MEIRKELKLSKEEIRTLEEIDILTEEEFSEKYGGSKAKPRMYVIPFEDDKTGTYNSSISISVVPGEGHNKGNTSITLAWDVYGRKVQFAENGSKFTGEYTFPMGEDKTYRLDVVCSEPLEKWKVKAVDLNKALRSSDNCYAFTLQTEDGKERDVFLPMHSKMMYNIMQEALLVNERRTAREAFWSLSKECQKDVIQSYIDKETAKNHEVVSLSHTLLQDLSLSARCLFYREADCNMDNDKDAFFTKACSQLGKSEETVINEALQDFTKHGLESFKLNLKDGQVVTCIPIWVQEQLERNGSFEDMRKDLIKELGMEKTGLGKKKNQNAIKEKMDFER